MAFLKAIDLSFALQAPDTMKALETLTLAFNFERDVLTKCHDKRLSHVVTSIGHGQVQVEEAEGVKQVPYLLFEQADGDVQNQTDLLGQTFDLAFALRALHHIALGLGQLHGQQIAHQDIKPSNVLVFGGKTSKVADLGRSASKAHEPPHHHEPIPGDPSYAPPERLYHLDQAEWNARRFGCDAYLLGSMVVFFFTGAALTPQVQAVLPEAHRWRHWTGTYADVLPYLRDAFDRVMEEFSPQVPSGLRDRLVTAVRELCDPDPSVRGHPRNRAIAGSNQYSVQRYVSLFDLQAKQAEYGMRKDLQR